MLRRAGMTATTKIFMLYSGSQTLLVLKSPGKLSKFCCPNYIILIK